MEQLITYALLGLSCYVCWLIYQFLGRKIDVGTDESYVAAPTSGLRLASKRCTKCGIHPKPSDMVMLWGYNWEKEDTCLHCKRERGSTAVVIMVPKLLRFKLEEIKDWYVPVAIREFARKTYMNTDNYTQVYLSDGKRFWAWKNWAYYKDKPTNWDDFNKAFPSWKLLEMPEPVEEKKTEYTYPDISSYVSY